MKNIQDLDMQSLIFSDGTISTITSRLGVVVVDFVDWQEKNWSLIFNNAIAYKSISAEGEEISALRQLSDTEFSREVKSAGEGTASSYCFVSAWSEQVVLTIVAEGYIASIIS